MRSGVLVTRSAVAGLRHHDPVAHDDRADGNFTGASGGARFVERRLHPPFVVGASDGHARGYAPTVSRAGSLANSSPPLPSGRTTIASPSPNRPSSTASASGFWISRWIDR